MTVMAAGFVFTPAQEMIDESLSEEFEIKIPSFCNDRMIGMTLAERWLIDPLAEAGGDRGNVDCGSVRPFLRRKIEKLKA
jgi:hypothetical protein